MNTEPIIERWQGASFAWYDYQVFDLHNIDLPLPDLGKGNYIFAKFVGYQWQPVYIGQGILNGRISPEHHALEGIRADGATHLHMHANADEAKRLAEERDLLDNPAHARVYQSGACNQR